MCFGEIVFGHHILALVGENEGVFLLCLLAEVIQPIEKGVDNKEN